MAAPLVRLPSLDRVRGFVAVGRPLRPSRTPRRAATYQSW